MKLLVTTRSLPRGTGGGFGMRVPGARRVVALAGRAYGAVHAISNASLWVFAALLAIVATHRWFLPGRLIAGGDAFPLTIINPDSWARRMRYTWDSTYALGGPAGALLYLVPIVVNTILRTWFAPDVTQHIDFALLVGGEFLAMAFLVLTILPGHRFAALIAGLFYCFNPASVLGGPTLLGMFGTVYLPYMFALLIRAATAPSRSPYIPLFVISTGASSFLSTNPPALALFAIVNVVIAAYMCWNQRQRALKIIRRFIILGILAVLANVYWAVSLYYSLFGNSQGSSIAAVTNPLSLSFVYQRDSILNMFWLNPIWAWNLDYAYPYAHSYRAPLLLILVFLPALLAFSALLNKRIPRRIVLPATGLALVILFICTALHGPWQSINLFLFQHVPFFWLLRQPDTKLLGYLLLLYAPLIGYQAEWLARSVMQVIPRRRWRADIAHGAVLIPLGICFMVMAFPILTGEVAGVDSDHRPRGSTILTNQMAIPQYWFDLSRYLTLHDPQAPILVLPNDDFYSMPYKWGFYGADSLPTELLPNPEVTLTNVPTSYTSGPATYEGFKSKMLYDLSAGRHRFWGGYLAAQGIKYIVQRNDIDSSSTTRHILPSAQIKAFLRAQDHVHLLRTFGQLDLYEVDSRAYVPPVYAVPLGSVRSTAQHAGSVDQRIAVALGLQGSGAGHGVPRVVRPIWHKQNPTRFLVHISAKTGPVVLVLSALYNRNWHACILPRTVSPGLGTCWLGGTTPSDAHIRPLGFANGWIIDRPGPYTVVIDYGYQHFADALQLISALTAIIVVAWVVLPRLSGLVTRLARSGKLMSAPGMNDEITGKSRANDP